ncbi:hypothetical protein ABPG74_006795 [Tetrahymena malaccensis]
MFTFERSIIQAKQLYGTIEKKKISKEDQLSLMKDNKQKNQHKDNPNFFQQRQNRNGSQKKQSISSKDYDQNIQEFTALNWWFMRFNVRKKLSFQVQTHSILKLGNSRFTQIDTFLNQLRDFRLKKAADKKQLLFISIDEFPLYIDMTGKTSLQY